MDLALVVRILHIAAAVVAGGAAVFQLIAVRPALATLDDPQRKRVQAEIVRRWWLVVLVLVGLLLITGLVNFMIRLPQLRENPHKGLYHMLFGLKFLAALGVFHFAVVLSLPPARFDRWRARAGTWLPIMVGLVAAAIVLGELLTNFERVFGAT